MYQQFELPALDLTPISGGTNFMANTWAYGFDPNMCWVGFMPNWADTVRVSTCGTVLSILVDGRSLLDAFAAQDVLELETVTPAILISEC